MSCKDCTCSTCIDIRIDNFQEKFSSFIASGWDLVEAWNEDEVLAYPLYLPSFDEFLMNFQSICDGDFSIEDLEFAKEQSLKNVEYIKMLIEKKRLK